MSYLTTSFAFLILQLAVERLADLVRVPDAKGGCHAGILDFVGLRLLVRVHLVPERG